MNTRSWREITHKNGLSGKENHFEFSAIVSKREMQSFVMIYNPKISPDALLLMAEDLVRFAKEVKES